MACCGQSRNQVAIHPADAKARPARTLFEYRGRGPLTLYGRVTGMRYHFPGPGARVHVDARDARVLSAIAELEEVSP